MIVCIGEILADMIGFNKDGVISFNRYAGGAPFNVACDIKKLQGKAGFVGCVGNDLSFAKGICKIHDNLPGKT